MPDLEPVRLYLIGTIDSTKSSQGLTTLAEWGRARGLASIQLDKSRLDLIAGKIAKLKAFIEGGVPGFGRTALSEMGGQLFDIVIRGQVRDLFQRATGAARLKKMSRLPLEIIAEDFAIAGWPWEYLYDNDSDFFISQEFHPISRSVFTLDPPLDFEKKDAKVRVLILLGVPPDDLHTTPREELAAIHNVFSTQLDQNSFEIRVLDPSDFAKLQMELQNNSYDIVHFFGHAGFDPDAGKGYLTISRPTMKPFKFPADEFARLLKECSGTRLVFLNACKTAEGAPAEGPARSSVAGALLSRGIPAVVGAQFSLPDQSAHFLAATIYNTLLTGRPLDEAMRSGRIAMCLGEDTRFFDWGIPVLYSTNPSIKLFDGPQKTSSWASLYTSLGSGEELVAALSRPSTKEVGGPSVIVDEVKKTDKSHEYSVAFIDIDSKVGFLPELIREANAQQNYYEFKLAYVPIPTGYARSDLGQRVETYIPRLESYLLKMPESLSADFVCCLTQNPVAGKNFSKCGPPSSR